MNKQDKHLLIAQELYDYKDDKQLSLQQLEQEIGISYATISNVINKKLDNVSDNMMRKIAAFLRIDTWAMLETDNFATVKETLRDAQDFRRFVGIIGKSGYGKSSALHDYKRNNKNCYYVLSNVLMYNKSQFLTAIQKSMGISKGVTAAEMLDAICLKMISDEKSQLIVDDAGKLNDGNLRVLQLLYDRTERNASLVIAGTPYLKSVLENGITRNKMGFDEIYRRVEHWEILTEPTMQEKAAFCEYHGLNGEDKEAVGMIVNTSKNFGTLRAKITLALRLKDKGKLTANALKSVN